MAEARGAAACGAWMYPRSVPTALINGGQESALLHEQDGVADGPTVAEDCPDLARSSVGKLESNCAREPLPGLGPHATVIIEMHSSAWAWRANPGQVRIP